jgi:multidrug resistance efflux pump
LSRPRRIAIIASSLTVASILAALFFWHARRHPGTDDAYIDADVVLVAPQIEGPIVNIAVEAHQSVAAGDLLFEIDPRPFRIAVAKARAEVDQTGQDVSALADAVVSAEAQLQEAQAQLRLARAQYQRIQPLVKVGAVPYQDKDKADAGLSKAESSVVDAKARLAQAMHNLGETGENNPELRSTVAELENAELELSYAQVASPVNGLVTDPTPVLGSYASPGEAVVTLVNTDTWRVVAYFRETQLRDIHPGQPARIQLPAYPGVRFDGIVQGVGWGVEQQDGETGADGLPNVSPTVDWVRMAQRFPVRITLLDRDPAHPLRKGMRATVRIDAAANRADSGDAP